MQEILVSQMPAFKKAFKKLHSNQKKAVKKAIKEIVENPEIGIAKKGDLSGVFVYKFKINNQGNCSPHCLRPAACPRDPCDLSDIPGSRGQAAGRRGIVVTNQEYLLAHEWLPQERILLALGVHENFYRNMKR